MISIATVFVGTNGAIPETCRSFEFVSEELWRRQEIYNSHSFALKQRSKEMKRLEMRIAALRASIEGQRIENVARNPNMEETIGWFEATLEHIMETSGTHIIPAVTAFVRDQSRSLRPLLRSHIALHIGIKEHEKAALSSSIVIARRQLESDRSRFDSLTYDRARLLAYCVKEMEFAIAKASALHPDDSAVMANLRTEWNRYLALSLSLP